MNCARKHFGYLIFLLCTCIKSIILQFSDVFTLTSQVNFKELPISDVAEIKIFDLLTHLILDNM